jgi:branched-chain amino acid transport system permease protein
MDNYLVAMAVFAGLYALLALGLNVVWGMAGMINLGLVGFFGVGAYTSALLTRKGGAPIAMGLVAAAVLTAAAGAVMALTTARLRGDYLAIITLGFSEVVRIVASNELWLTNGTDGISGIPGPWRGAVPPRTFNLVFLAIVVVVVALALLVCQRIRHSPYGRVLRAIRDDDQVAAVAGKRVIRFKVEAFAVSAAILGIAGALWAHYTSFVAPDVFAPLVTIYIVLALTAGGTGNNVGAVVGAALVIFLMEATRFASAWVPALKPVQVAALREALIGIGLLVVLRLRPRGLLPERIAPLAARHPHGDRA